MSPAPWSLTVLRYADSTLPERDVFPGGRKDMRLPITFLIYVIRTADCCILVDPGCDTMPGFDMVDYVLPVETLRRAGVTPEMVTDVIITHAHHDHIDALRHFPQAAVHIQRAEYEAGKGYIPASCPLHCFDEEASITEEIRIKRVGGHTPGSSVVILTGREKPWVLCGDACYLRICLEKHLPTGVSCNIEESCAFVETYGTDAYRTFLCHEPTTPLGDIE